MVITANDNQPLDEHLQWAYAAKVLNKGNYDDVRRSLRDSFSSVSGLRDVAVLRLEGLKNIPEERCYVSKVYREFLEETLNG